MLCAERQSINFKGFFGQNSFPIRSEIRQEFLFNRSPQKLNRIYHHRGNLGTGAPGRVVKQEQLLQVLAAATGPSVLLNFHASTRLIIRRNKRKLKCNWQPGK